MFTVDINDGQWLQYMCTQILNAFTISKVGMHADVVANGGGASCDVDGQIWSTSSRYCGYIILECGTLAGARWDVQFVVTHSVAAYSMRAEFISQRLVIKAYRPGRSSELVTRPSSLE